ncbi:MAG: transcription-repair coupling factor [Oscillospiraceae bacterium]|nr:transcription-repair coupling factor [Oscillospiraceae bacterium]
MRDIMLLETIKTTKEYEKLKDAVQKGGVVALFGLPPVARAQMVAALCQDTARPAIVLTPGEAEATRFAADAAFFGARSGIYPARDFTLRSIEGQSHEYEYRRLQVLGDAVGGRINVLCAPVEGALQYTVPKAEFISNTLTIKETDKLPQKKLIERLISAGYYRRDRVDGPGQFSVRGGIVDIFAPDMKLPTRIEYWGDDIDSMNTFDLITQRRDTLLEKIYLSPAREVLFAEPAEALAVLTRFAQKAPDRTKHAVQTALEADIAALQNGMMPATMDKYLPLRYARPATVLDYFENPILFLEEPSNIKEAQKATEWRTGEETKTLFEQGVLCPGLDKYAEDYVYLTKRCAAGTAVAAENFARTLAELPAREIINAAAHSLPTWAGDVSGLVEDLQPMVKSGYFCAVLAGTARAATALAKDLQAAGLTATACGKNVLPRAGSVAVVEGHLSAGVDYPFAKTALITSRRAAAAEGKKKKKQPKGISSLEDIKAGDFVVHQNHGIGRYIGIERLDLQGVVKDYIKLSYDKGDTLYVPVTQMDIISQYTAPGDSDRVKLAKLGGTEWVKTKNRVRKATQEMAQELIELYAKRQQAKGYAFAADGDWQQDFEARFEYEETGDQLTSAAEIKKDMERPFPMDRLLCGDVGVGKTEVALRAAFKCIADGKQCAVLVPTTILAWQHYNTFLRRMEAFPVKIGLLSRFRSAAQQKQTIADLKAGVCDVVVGTHRLLSQDIKFKDLGLVIIDEEQRFGVKHKEKLKETFIGVDMLTLSATPIPRTLNMAMSGIRDMSTIEEPPFERQPIETYVMEYNPMVVEQAIKKELSRGGQVYYLHNRVETIDLCAAKVAQMAPGATVATAHGKMTEEQLSAVWQKLLDGEIDILVCTTIIETGIDVRNCNTLVIEDADRMGLAQLYQIRGRVGRSGRKAYAYFTFHRDKVLTDVASKRLSAIREFTSFGSGFRIAMRDLQIRGAGSLLGQSQHGHMEAVGYDMYVRLLNQAISVAKGETPPRSKSECLIDITVDAYITEKYIPDSAGRVEAYKRIAAIETKADASDVLDELIDRYGEMPSSVSGLIDISLIRVVATQLGIYEITQRGETLILYSDCLGDYDLKPLLESLRGRITVNAGAKPYISARIQAGEKPLDVLNMVFEKMMAYCLPQAQATPGEEAKTDRKV